MGSRIHRKSAFTLEGLEGRNYLSSLGGVVMTVGQGLAYASPAVVSELNPQPLPPKEDLTAVMNFTVSADDDLNPQPLPPLGDPSV